MVNIALSLIGVFVFFFAFFVLTYFYFKCFRKTPNTIGFKNNEWKANYKSLKFETVEPQIPLDFEPQEGVNTEYLTPVLSFNTSVESCEYGANEMTNEKKIFSDAKVHGQRVSQETSNNQNEPNLTQNDVQDHVYIEITDEKIESAKCDED